MKAAIKYRVFAYKTMLARLKTEPVTLYSREE